MSISKTLREISSELATVETHVLAFGKKKSRKISLISDLFLKDCLRLEQKVNTF